MTRPLDEFSTPTPTSIRIVRRFDAPLGLVWRAHTEPELVKQWMTGPEGHSLPVCEIDFRVGGTGRYVWKNPEFEMGMTAEFKEIVHHERIVYSELYDGVLDRSEWATPRDFFQHGPLILVWNDIRRRRADHVWVTGPSRPGSDP